MLALVLGLLWGGAVALAVLDGRRRAVGWLGVALLIAALAAAIVLTATVLRDGPVTVMAGDWPEGVGIRLRADPLGLIFAVLSLAVLAAALAHQVVQGIVTRSFPALVLALGTGLTGLFLTGDIFNFYVFFELALIAAYVLASYANRARETRAALIFAVVNLLGSFLFLIGIASLYAITGTLDMDQVGQRVAELEPGASFVVAVLFFVAFGVKLGLFPFHFWLPAVYTGSRPAVAAILSGAVANIGSYGLLRFGADILPAELAYGATAFLVIGGATIVYGSLQAISTNRVSEVIAYSSIGQVGFVLVAIGVGGPAGFGAAILYTVVNALNKLLLFLAVGVRGWLVGAVFAVGALSVAGVPPSAGFFGKLLLFEAGVESGSAALVALLALGSALSFVYMFQAYQHRHWVQADADRDSRCAPGERVVVIAVAVVVLALGLWPEPMLDLSRAAAAALDGGA